MISVRRNTTATVISRLSYIFSMFCIPPVLRTDNVPPFHGEEFASYATEMRLKHRRIMPMHPEANGVMDHFMKTLSKAVLTSHILRQNMTKELSTFLLNYIAEQLSSTSLTSSSLMFVVITKIQTCTLGQVREAIRCDYAVKE